MSTIPPAVEAIIIVTLKRQKEKNQLLDCEGVPATRKTGYIGLDYELLQVVFNV
jgi:hypothetical protein